MLIAHCVFFGSLMGEKAEEREESADPENADSTNQEEYQPDELSQMPETLEDRILEMQAMKRDLADQILSGDALSSSNITREVLMQILS